MTLTYLASPYSHPASRIRSNRARMAALAAWKLRQMGVTPLSPIAHSHAIATVCHIDPHAADWYEWDSAFIDACSDCVVLCIHGWRESKGVTAEIAEFERQGKRVRYLVNGKLQDGEPEEEK